MKSNIGLVYAMSAYLWWGIIPIFWKQLDHVPSMEIVAHRVVWGFVLVLGFIIFTGKLREFLQIFNDRMTMVRLFLASTLVTTNWGIFIWAVNNEFIVETSLGYFINPLITVLFGLLFFGESLRRAQKLALLIAFGGVVVMVVATGGLPLISLSLATTFALYSVMKKKVSLPASHGLAFETLLMVIPSFLIILYYVALGTNNFQPSDDLATSFLLVLGGLFTLIPLLLFAAAAKRVSLVALGMTQYLGPTCQLLIAVFVYKEPFSQINLIAFSCIWLALLVYTIDQINNRRKKRRPI
ncbi:MAG: EamA family transporter RarD [Gammaproteobacteria bacterium]|nr:EamA family transporter RarD [Gammaproteobacteria bacterium]